MALAWNVWNGELTSSRHGETWYLIKGEGYQYEAVAITQLGYGYAREQLAIGHLDTCIEACCKHHRNQGNADA